MSLLRIGPARVPSRESPEAAIGLLLERGYAPWEVRVEARSLREAHDLAEELRAEGFDVSRTFTYVIVGTESREQAVELAQRIHGRVQPGGELVYEVQPQNPFAVFGGLGT